MDYSVTFARHFSRLLWLLLHEPRNVNEQKAALRALVVVAREGPITISATQGIVVVNGKQLPEALPGVQELAERLARLAVRELRIEREAVAGDVLGAARMLARDPDADGGHVTQTGGGQELGAGTVRVDVTAPHQASTVVPEQSPRVVAAEPPAAERPRDSAAARKSRAPESAGAAQDSSPDTAAATDRPHDSEATQKSRTPESTATPASRAAEAAPAPEISASDAAPETREIERAAVPMRGARESMADPAAAVANLLDQLDNARSLSGMGRALEQLVTLAEDAAREGRVEEAADAFHGIVRREAEATNSDRKRSCAIAIRRLSKPVVLRALASRLPGSADRREQYMQILATTGEDGAEAIIEQLTVADSLADRRVLYDALVRMKAGVAALVHMLGDPRWYVARNAADLLGEMQVLEAEGPLMDVLRHDDERVRRAAAASLAKLGTPRALHTLRDALRDSSPQVRIQAAAGIAARKGRRSAATLCRALDEELDADVQLVLLGALGRLATADAVQRLITAAEPDGRLFRKKSVAYRVAAVNALGQAGTGPALQAVSTLVDDRDRDVRDAAQRIVSQRAQAAGEPRAKAGGEQGG